jgi:hypothetical protein
MGVTIPSVASFHHIVTTLGLGHIVSTITSHLTVALYHTVTTTVTATMSLDISVAFNELLLLHFLFSCMLCCRHRL